MLLAYTILLPDELSNRIRYAKFAVDERYGNNPQTMLSPPHITVKVPFATVEPVGRFSDYLRRLAAETQPFEIVVRGPAVFEGAGVAFYDVQQDERLHALQRRILRDLQLEPLEHEATGYHFHVTVAEGLSVDDARTARDQLEDFGELRFPLKRIGLWRKVESAGYWTIYEVARVA